MKKSPLNALETLCDIGKNLKTQFELQKEKIRLKIISIIEDNKNGFCQYLEALESQGKISPELKQSLAGQIESDEVFQKLRIWATAEVIEQWEYALVPLTAGLLYELSASPWLFFPINGGIMVSTRFAIYKILSRGQNFEDENDFAMRGSLPLFGLLTLSVILSKYQELGRHFIAYKRGKGKD